MPGASSGSSLLVSFFSRKLSGAALAVRMPIQWIIVVFATFAIVQAWRAFVGGSLDRRKLLLWSVFWVVVASVVLLPQVTSVMAAWLGVGRGVDLVLYLSVALLFYAL